MLIPGKNKFIISFIALFSVFTLSTLHAFQKADAVVAQDGSGSFTSIQEAINAAPVKTDGQYIILIKKGIYKEKLFIEKNFITLLGEDKDSTQIIYAELRSNWKKDHPGNDWGSAVVNVGNKVTDLIIANLTIYNNYGSLYGNNDHQFAIRGGGTRVIILNSTLKADGGDTVSLWNTIDGMYYFSSCYFEGYVDYVCPRGWCYITDSKFYGHNLTASIWHDGSNDKDQKFVIRHSYFDGVKGFPLGRNHRDGQFFLLDCSFSSNMADKPIFQSSADSTYKWGRRCYYYDCSGEGGNFAWFRNNLDKAQGSPSADKITGKWTFAEKWDPEETIGRMFNNFFQLR